MDTHTTTRESYVTIPEGLTPEARTAAELIVEFLTENEITYTGGCQTFFTPQEWRERGEDYGTDAVLIVAYDGSSVGRAFSLDRYDYATVEAMSERLAQAGYLAQECTVWYSAIYLHAQDERPAPAEPGELAGNAQAASEALTAAVRDLLNGRAHRCHPSCDGYFINAESGLVNRCDECATLNGYDLTDRDLCSLPEVWEAMRKAAGEGA